MEGLEKYGRIGEAGCVTDRTVEEWQARRCMERLCKEKFGVAGGVRLVLSRCNKLRRERKGAADCGRPGMSKHCKVSQGAVRPCLAGMAG